MVIDEKDVFVAALALPHAKDREAYLQEACAGYPELLGRLRELLSAHEESQGPLDRRPSALGATVDAVHTETPGTVIGPYKLLQQIGEGGMGTVFMAEQTQPVHRKVALKLIKSGMDSHQVIARCEAERQALALMDHPNIARVLDAGTTETGRPYFVMELVKGVPITRYCDEHHLTPKERLELFVPVCLAVQHAHQKGIIHRDLKPSNVMVCLYDGKPVPKVIDFGVAKATGARLTEKTLFTELGQVVGTLEYMSPEQAELNQLDIDTRSDIYSLGVLLYELLTGTTPLERKRFQAVAFLEVLRLIREEESPRPSTRLSTSEGLPAIAANRSLDAKQLTGLMRGELDWILMRTLEKDRTRRYETANDFARDIQRYLHDESVEACPPSAWYRFRKFARRNKAVLGMSVAAGVVVLAGVVGLAVSNVLLDRKQQATNEALAKETAATEELTKTVRRERQNYYRYAFQLARRDWLAADLEPAREHLQDCPTEFRDRDWEYLDRVCHADLFRIDQPIGKLRYSPDGKYLAGIQGETSIWDAVGGKLQTKISTLPERVESVAFSSDGNELVVATNGQPLFPTNVADKEIKGPGFAVKVLDWRTKRLVGGFRRKDSLGHAVLSPDGSRVVLIAWLNKPGDPLVGTDTPKSVTVCETRTGRELCTLAVPTGYTLYAVAFLPDGQVVTVSSDLILRFWDGATGKPTRVMRDYPSGILAFSPDGQRFAAASSRSKPVQVKVWDVRTLQEIAVLRGHVGPVVGSFAFSHDGRRLATGGVDKAVIVWDVDSGRELLTLRGHLNPVTEVAFSPDGARLATSDNIIRGTTIIWDVRPLPD